MLQVQGTLRSNRVLRVVLSAALSPTSTPPHSCGGVIAAEADGAWDGAPVPISGGDVDEERCWK